MRKRKAFDPQVKCSCGAYTYTGGWCFKCGKYTPSKGNRNNDENAVDERSKMNMGHRLGEFTWPPNSWNE